MTLSRRTALSQIAARAIMLPAAGALLWPSGAIATPTPFTDIGPFYPVARTGEEDGDLTLIGKGKRAKGQVIEIVGRVLDGKGAPLARSRVEVWQANAAGKYAHAGDTSAIALDPQFQGFGVVTTDAGGDFRFLTIMPGAYPIPTGQVRPPHIHLDVSARNDRLITQMLFPGDPRNDKDEVLANVDRKLLVATDRGPGANGARRFEWNVILANG